jgi:CRP-like cAMP-binding protein
MPAPVLDTARKQHLIDPETCIRCNTCPAPTWMPERAAKFLGREYIGPMAVSSPDLKAFLVATPFFGGLSDASLELLISMLVERRFDVGATVVAEGEPGRSMYVVHAGELVVSKLGEAGRAIRVAGLGPGDFFGEMTLIEVQNRSATVVAESPTVLYELTARNLYTYYKADLHAYVIVMQNINRELCRRLRRANNRIAELADAAARFSLGQ